MPDQDYTPRWPQEGAAPPPPEPFDRPRAGRVLARTLRRGYESLGTIALGSLAWSLLVPTLGALAVAASSRSLLGLLLVVPFAAGTAAAQAAVWYAGYRLATGTSQGPRDLPQGVICCFLPSLGVTLVLLAALLLLAANLLFYGSLGGWAAVMVAVFLVYAALFLLAVYLYAYAFIVQQGAGTRLALYRAALVALDNPLFTGELVLAQLVLWAFALLPLVLALPFLSGLSVLWLLFAAAGSSALLSNEALREVMRKYQTEAG